MSLFLGKIHYWLFNKVLWFENLEEEVIALAKEVGMNAEELEKEASAKYGARLPKKPLEELIDQSNIHGWLQASIHSAEGRMAFYTRAIIVNDVSNITKLQKIYINQGIKAANEVLEEGEIDTADAIYNKINDYILDGMPCDRVDEIIEATEDNVTWRKRICVHKDVWEREDINVEQFYNLRDLWIEAFVNKLNSDFQYRKNDDNTYSIKR